IEGCAAGAIAGLIFERSSIGGFGAGDGGGLAGLAELGSAIPACALQSPCNVCAALARGPRFLYNDDWFEPVARAVSPAARLPRDARRHGPCGRRQPTCHALIHGRNTTTIESERPT
ncbi:MAG: hypothetical protein KDD91_13690, partial [Caldilinea sp.]|nr:hypothetical protein [Caldilinea sp.]